MTFWRLSRFAVDLTDQVCQEHSVSQFHSSLSILVFTFFIFLSPPPPANFPKKSLVCVSLIVKRYKLGQYIKPVHSLHCYPTSHSIFLSKTLSLCFSFSLSFIARLYYVVLILALFLLFTFFLTFVFSLSFLSISVHFSFSFRHCYHFQFSSFLSFSAHNFFIFLFLFSFFLSFFLSFLFLLKLKISNETSLNFSSLFLGWPTHISKSSQELDSSFVAKPYFLEVKVTQKKSEGDPLKCEKNHL